MSTENQLPAREVKPPMVSPAQVAERMGVSRQAVYRLYHSKKLKGVKLGARTIRFEQQDVEECIKSETLREGQP